ncbi:MAG: hypothetical protein ACOCX5_02030 [Chloroflexota bacterium]
MNDDNQLLTNPFDLSLPIQQRPFAGREGAFERIQQHLSDPTSIPVPVFMGRAHIGKTALLKQFAGPARPSFIGVYVALSGIQATTERDWIHLLTQTIAETLDANGFTLESIQHTGADAREAPRQWLTEIFLPAVFRVIHRYRRLILLLDDAHSIVDQAESLVNLLTAIRQDQLAIVVTMDLDEDALLAFAPLITREAVYRLTILSAQAATDVLSSLRVEGLPFHQIAAEVVEASGGEPAIIQRYGYYLHDYLEDNPYAEAQKPATRNKAQSPVQAVTPAVYAEISPYFLSLWRSLTKDERLVLTGLSECLYSAPDRPVTTRTIEKWLIETDHPIDSTAINAALRSLEYRERVRGSAAEQLKINGGLFQKWLLENARLDGQPDTITSTVDDTRRDRFLLAALILILIFVVGMVIIASTVNNDGGGGAQAPLPTAELPTLPVNQP